MNELIYMDSAATTQLLDGVKDVIKENLDNYGNPSSLYSIGEENKIKIKQARNQIADYLGCKADWCIFTSGASESNSMILRGAFDYANKAYGGKHMIVSTIEHHSIMDTCKYLEEYHGVEVTYVGVDEQGYVKLDELEDAIRSDTFLISVMFVNNEIGTIQKIFDIAEIARRHGVFYHCDATQALGKINMFGIMKDIDFLSASAHKLGGPKGIGLCVTKHEIPALIGGTQEKSQRGGTENVLGILGFAKAVQEAKDNMYEHNLYVYKLMGHMRDRILNEIEDVKLNGPEHLRIPGNLNFTIKGIQGEVLMMMMNLRYGVCFSTGSACNSSSGEPSYVLDEESANSSIRISLSYQNTMEEVDYVCDALVKTIKEMRG